MKILVTGALGHIGSYIVRQIPLSFPNSEILMVDNLMTMRFTSLFNLPNIGKYKFIERDITKDGLDDLLTQVQVVIHLAAITDAAGSFERQEELENNNFIATKKIADGCLKHNIKLIALSSTSVYGTQNLLVAEDCSMDELKPQSPYAVTKLKEENYVSKLCNESGLNAIILRFGTIYGISSGMRFHTAVNKFCWQAVMNIPVTVWSTAYDQKRPYLDLRDAARAIDFIINNDIFDGEVYNVLSGNHTVCDIIESIKNHFNKVDIIFVENKIMNQLSYEVSNKKFTNKGFSFIGNIDYGISETINLLKASNSF
jgi:UDP-glucose 4-epimerase